MTVLPFDPRHSYTVAEFAALPEDTSARYELQDGVIVMSANPAKEHMIISYQLFGQVNPQLPRDLFSVGEIDVDLQLSSPVVRIPDFLIARRGALGQPGLTKASDVLLVVEIVSPSSKHMDTKIKPLEYADAGIPNFWLVDPRPPVTATVYHLVDGDYEESQRAEGTFTVDEPCPLTVDLDALLPPG